jgi:5-formyltetrahydrofolate cyclo-ligase
MDKATLRQRVWDALERSGTARFPFPPDGRIPNFAGAEAAADRLAERPEWADAETVKANPDAPQLPVRRRALRAGKTVYVAVPRLRETDPFLELDPERLADEGVGVDEATTVRGSGEHGVPVHPDAMPGIDLVVSGSVAVTDGGARVGKGEGYADLEFALLAAFDRVSEATVATTVHPMQVVPERLVTPDAHDVPLDLVVTPERTGTTGAERGTVRIDWDGLSDEKRAEIPVLERLYGSDEP